MTRQEQPNRYRQIKTIYELCYIPGLSSVQYLFDKIGWAWEDAELISNSCVSANIPAKVLHHAKVGTLLGGENQVQRSVSGLLKWDWEKSR